MYIFRSFSILFLITSCLIIIHLHPFFYFPYKWLLFNCYNVPYLARFKKRAKTIVRYNLKTELYVFCNFISYIYMSCPSGGGPSGGDAQNSFTLHVQTPLFPRVWVSAHFPLLPCQNLLRPRSTDFLRIGCNLEGYLSNHYKQFNKSSASAPLVFADAFFL